MTRPVAQPAAHASGLVALDISDFERPARAPSGEPAHMGWVATSLLMIDLTYQRDLGRPGRGHVLAIAEHFDWSCFGVIDVAPAEGVPGHYAVIDGQHRAHAAALLGIARLPCRILPLARREQAAAFARINGMVRALTPYHIFKAARGAGEPWAVAMDAIATRAGCKVMTYNVASHNRAPRELHCLDALRRMAERKVMHRALYVGLASLAASEQGARAAVWTGLGIRAWLEAVADVSCDGRCDPPGAERAFALVLARNDLRAMTRAVRDEVNARRDKGLPTAGQVGLLQARIDAAIEAVLPDRAAVMARAGK